MESIILRIWNSDYDTSGSLFQMSTFYQIIDQELNLDDDIEEQNRFYKKRDISQAAQNNWMFTIFMMSMNARIKATGIIGAIFIFISVLYYTNLLTLMNSSIPSIIKRKELIDEIA